MQQPNLASTDKSPFSAENSMSMGSENRYQFLNELRTQQSNQSHQRSDTGQILTYENMVMSEDSKERAPHFESTQPVAGFMLGTQPIQEDAISLR